MKKSLLIKNARMEFPFSTILFIFLFCVHANAQLYNNGSLSTGVQAANGTFAPVGYTWSEAQANTGNTTEVNISFGFAAYYNTASTSNYRIADDFTVPAGQTWNITNLAFFCHQISYAGTVPPIDVLRVQIYNGDPAAGGTLVAGDMVTNIYDAASSGEAFMYRISNTNVPAVAPTGILRKVWRVRAAITATLASGTYWVVYQGHAINDSVFYMLPVTIAGSRGAVTANAKQLIVSTSAWANIIDAGNPAAAPDVAQDMSFIINDVTLSKNQFDNRSAFSIYPNPVNSIFEIANSSSSKVIAIEIIDTTGRIVKVITPANEQTMFDCADLQVGNYVVKIKSEQGNEFKKIIKN